MMYMSLAFLLMRRLPFAFELEHLGVIHGFKRTVTWHIPLPLVNIVFRITTTLIWDYILDKGVLDIFVLVLLYNN